ncbi:MAG: hypothetical protein ICV83_26230 [Cytophagales bacterium]|nr:hypothetical protein [Cytophagales bacterium]
MFDDNSRYKDVPQYTVQDHRGRKVTVVGVPGAPAQSILGYHVLKQGQRVDHLAGRYLNDAAGFWKIAEANDAMLPEALSERSEIAIPNKR